MHILINTTPKTFPPHEAEAIAATLTANDDAGWTYRARHCPKGTGWSLVDVFDEGGEFVATWSQDA